MGNGFKISLISQKTKSWERFQGMKFISAEHVLFGWSFCYVIDDLIIWNTIWMICFLLHAILIFLSPRWIRMFFFHPPFQPDWTSQQLDSPQRLDGVESRSLKAWPERSWVASSVWNQPNFDGEHCSNIPVDGSQNSEKTTKDDEKIPFIYRVLTFNHPRVVGNGILSINSSFYAPGSPQKNRVPVDIVGKWTI